MKRILPYVRWFVAAAIGMIVVVQFGEALRDATPDRFHQSLWISGMALFCGTMIILAVFKNPPLGIRTRAWHLSMMTGAATGALLFCFYMTEIECRTTARHGVSCEYTGDELNAHP